jgi:DNA topoisomerase-1
VIAEKPKGRGGPQPLRVLGNHPEDGKPVGVYEGRYGAYVKHGRVNATLPRDISVEQVTLDQAIPLLAARAEQMGGKRRGAGGRAKPAAGAAKTGAAKAGAKKRKRVPAEVEGA